MSIEFININICSFDSFCFSFIFFGFLLRINEKGPKSIFGFEALGAVLFAYRIELQGASAQKCAYARLVADQLVVGE